jgi:hypothetical protein
MNIQFSSGISPQAMKTAWLVTGHDFSRAENMRENGLGFSPCCICFQPLAL